LQLRVDTAGNVQGMRRLSGTGLAAGAAESVARYQRYAPATDASGRPITVWWPVRISIPTEITLELKGLARGGIPGRPIPAGGFRIAELESGPPTFTPLTELPRILNPEEVARATAQSQPHAPGSGWYELPVFFLIDERGGVRRVELDGYSGNAPEFATVLDIARVYRFSPASDEGKPVPVWVRIWVKLRPPA
jgi:hypothetical protein